VTGEEEIVFHGGFHDLFYSPNITCVINPRGTGWARHVTRVEEKIHARNILVEQLEQMILGRPMYRRENRVKRYRMGERVLDSLSSVQGNWGGGGAVLKAIINLFLPKGATKFLTDLNTISFSRTLLHGVRCNFILRSNGC
jgi:hypothetical protein